MFALFENRLASAGETAAWLLHDPVSRFQGDAQGLAAVLAQARQDGHWVALALDYELGQSYEPKGGAAGGKTGEAGPARAWVFAQGQALEAAAVADFLRTELEKIPPELRLAGIGGLTAAWTKAHYLQAVEQVQDHIRAGDCYQVNLTFPLRMQTFGHPLALYAALRERQPAGHAAYWQLEEDVFLSLSPELFVQRDDNRLYTRPMKGTLPRGTTPVEDQAQRQRLQQCAKNRAENLMIVDLLRNDLARLGQAASNGFSSVVQVEVEELFAVEAYPTVWQMVSQVGARVEPSARSALNLENVLPALFPCGSITGAPKVRTMQIIQSLENQPRGIYTGALGWQSPDGDYRLNVAIRTLSVAPDGAARMGVGSGLVQDSVGAEEWDECWLKARFLTDFDPGIELIETLRWENGVFHRLEAHLQRMQASADWLGFVFDLAQIRAALAAHAPSLGSGAWRIRLALRKTGAVQVECQPLLPETPTADRVRLARQPIDSTHPLQRHKTAWRPRYDEAMQALAEDAGLFDVLYFNERDELVEGARTSVFVLLDGVWQTPPLSAGALPGIWRAAVLAEEETSLPNACEATLSRADVLRAEQVVCGNSLRGGRRVYLDATPF